MLADEIYLTFYARYPSSDERAAALDYFKDAESHTGEGRRKAAEDLAWSLMNTVEFCSTIEAC